MCRVPLTSPLTMAWPQMFFRVVSVPWEVRTGGGRNLVCGDKNSHKLGKNKRNINYHILILQWAPAFIHTQTPQSEDGSKTLLVPWEAPGCGELAPDRTAPRQQASVPPSPCQVAYYFFLSCPPRKTNLDLRNQAWQLYLILNMLQLPESGKSAVGRRDWLQMHFQRSGFSEDTLGRTHLHTARLTGPVTAAKTKPRPPTRSLNLSVFRGGHLLPRGVSNLGQAWQERREDCRKHCP